MTKFKIRKVGSEWAVHDPRLGHGRGGVLLFRDGFHAVRWATGTPLAFPRATR